MAANNCAGGIRTDRGLLTPDLFLPAIESGVLALEVGAWVMTTACAEAVRLRQNVPALVMGVNLFGAQFRTGHLAEDVARVLQEPGLPPEGLELEAARQQREHQRVAATILPQGH